MNFLHIRQREDLMVSDTHISSPGWWADKYCLSFLEEYRGRWTVSFALPKKDCPCLNFPAVIDDYGNLVRV